MAKTPYFIKNCLKRLDLQRSTRKGSLLKSLHHFDCATGKTRQKRQDRRANLYKLLSAMIPKLDLDTMAYGQFFTNHHGQTDFYTRGIDTLCAETGLQERTVVRCLSDLERAGYLKVARQEAIGKFGNVKRHYSLRKFTDKFFIELGFKKKTIEDTRSWKRKKNASYYSAQKFSETCVNGLFKLKKVMHHATQATKKLNKLPTLKAVQQRNPADTKQLLAKAAAIAERLGTSPLEEYRKLTT